MDVVLTMATDVDRSLVMVAKCLQNLANLVEFGGKEPHMEVVNPFILKNKERMIYYLDQLSVHHLLLDSSRLILHRNCLSNRFIFELIRTNELKREAFLIDCFDSMHRTNDERDDWLRQNVKEKPEVWPEDGLRGDPARDLGTLHHICVTHIKDLHLMAKTKVLSALYRDLREFYRVLPSFFGFFFVVLLCFSRITKGLSF